MAERPCGETAGTFCYSLLIFDFLQIPIIDIFFYCPLEHIFKILKTVFAYPRVTYRLMIAMLEFTRFITKDRVAKFTLPITNWCCQYIKFLMENRPFF